MREQSELYDDFADNRGEGAVVGTLSTSGARRLGVDVEGVLSIDNEALRIAPLIEAGFGRAVVAYGPFSSRPGLAFAVHILNGHNTSQSEPLPDTFRERMSLWLSGSEIDPKWPRLVQWIRSGRVRRTFRKFRWWRRTAKNGNPVRVLDENLAVGWFSNIVVADPCFEGNTFIMHALGPENGELWTGSAGCRTRSLRGVQNIPLYLVSIVRANGVVYYVSSLDRVPGVASFPRFQPVGVGSAQVGDDVYVGIHQSVLGQIGFRLDTRVRNVRVGRVGGYETWCGGAHAADRLVGQGDLNGTMADAGGTWRVLRGKAHRGANGATATAPGTRALLDSGSPCGLIHASVLPGTREQSRVGVLWRFRDEENHWRVEVGAGSCQIIRVVGGDRQLVVSSKLVSSNEKCTCRVQVLDDGHHLMAYVDGEPVSACWVADSRLEGETGVGIVLDDAGDGGGTVAAFEAHPRAITLSDAFELTAPWVRKGVDLVVADDFRGERRDLSGRLTPVGAQRWSRLLGSGVIETTGEGAARVRASVQEPCPDRTAYSVDWSHPDFADLEVTITPPGSKRGNKERGIAGFILFQDPANYVTLNIWRTDYYGGSSISTFFKFGGFEDLYDAIWTNVGDRVSYGQPARIRLCCDGEQYLVFVNDEPVLYRAFRDVYPDIARLKIRKVGLLANWEFGTDTGSRFDGFLARS